MGSDEEGSSCDVSGVSDISGMSENDQIDFNQKKSIEDVHGSVGNKDSIQSLKM